MLTNYLMVKKFSYEISWFGGNYLRRYLTQDSGPLSKLFSDNTFSTVYSTCFSPHRCSQWCLVIIKDFLISQSPHKFQRISHNRLVNSLQENFQGVSSTGWCCRLMFMLACCSVVDILHYFDISCFVRLPDLTCII